MASDIEAFRVIDYGGYYSQSSDGGAALEYWAVKGLTARQRDEAHAVGLPQRGEFHSDPKFVYVGTVQDVRCVREFGATGWLAQVVYSTGGTFNFSTRLGSQSQTVLGSVPLPLISEVSGVRIEVRGNTTFRPHSIYRITSRSGLSESVINRTSSENLGKVYELDGLKYQLLGSTTMTDAGNNTRVDTSFLYRAPIAAIAGTEYGPSYLNIPELPANCEWVTQTADISSPAIKIRDPEVVRGLGDPLPWL